MKLSPFARSFFAALVLGMMVGILAAGHPAAANSRIVAEGGPSCNPSSGVTEIQDCANYFTEVANGSRDGIIGLSGNGRQILLHCVSGEIADYAEFSSVGIVFPVEHLGGSCQETDLKQTFPGTEIISFKNPTSGWTILVNEFGDAEATICVGATLFEVVTPNVAGSAIDPERQSKECTMA